MLLSNSSRTSARTDYTKNHKRTPNPNILPDIGEPNFYCESCPLKHRTLGGFRSHLRSVHKMKLTPLVKRPIFDPTISVSDTQNLNNASCAICKLKYSSKASYKWHMKHFHDGGRTKPADRKELVDPKIQPDPNDPNLLLSLMPKTLLKPQQLS